MTSKWKEYSKKYKKNLGVTIAAHEKEGTIFFEKLNKKMNRCSSCEYTDATAAYV